MNGPTLLRKSTSKSEIAALPRFFFEGPTHVIISENEAIRAVSALEKHKILGIDTETRPSFKRGISHRVALLQIASFDACFLFRLNRMGLPECLVRLLERKDILKIGLSLKDDFLMLHGRSDFTPQGIVELQEYVKAMGISDMSLQKIYANIFGKRISKSARLSNWEADSLSEAQQIYAATDAYACLQLYTELEKIKANGYQIIDKEEVTATDEKQGPEPEGNLVT